MEESLVILVPILLLYVVIIVMLFQWFEKRLFRRGKRILRGVWGYSVKENLWCLTPLILVVVLTVSAIIISYRFIG